MQLCHIKHSELAKHLQSFKGRVVFRGDTVKDETGYLAVFSEQGTSASHLEAAKFLDAISRFPDCDGEEADTTGAYNQSELPSSCPPTWIRLPRDRWPKEWHGKFTDPVVKLRVSLYGHPLAGLYWENHCRDAILK